MRTRRFLISGVLVLILMLCNMNVSAYAVENITVVVDGKTIQFDQPPILDAESGRVLVPMRAIFEALGYTVEWDAQRQWATAEKEIGLRKVDVTANIKSRFLYVMYNEYASEKDKSSENYWTRFYFSVPLGNDFPVKIINGRTLLPTRAIAEALGCKVDWDGTAKTVTIDTSGPGLQVPKGWEPAIQKHFKTFAPQEYSETEEKEGCYDSQYVYKGTKGIRPTEPVKISQGILSGAAVNTTAAPSSTPAPTEKPKTVEETQKEYALEVIRIVNKMRVEQGLNELLTDEKLMHVAQTRAEGLAKMEQFPDNHVLTGLGDADDTAKLLGYNFDGPGHVGVGENMNGEWSPQGAVDYWMSDDHKYELLRPETTSRYVGVGCAYDAKIDGYCWVWNSSYYPGGNIQK